MKIIADNSNGNPKESMRLLQMAYINSRAGNKEIMEMKDVKKAVELLAEKKSKGQ